MSGKIRPLLDNKNLRSTFVYSATGYRNLCETFRQIFNMRAVRDNSKLSPCTFTPFSLIYRPLIRINCTVLSVTVHDKLIILTIAKYLWFRPTHSIFEPPSVYSRKTGLQPASQQSFSHKIIFLYQLQLIAS